MPLPMVMGFHILSADIQNEVHVRLNLLAACSGQWFRLRPNLPQAYLASLTVTGYTGFADVAVLRHFCIEIFKDAHGHLQGSPSLLP